ncbi:hypothetical protein B0T20DRAFT_92550 [Sordaria brevicollis]|uniref:Uncharacterized protein n=1 Tax=Sordaria brevicollis TaxID=83679 RepID=A0AAE0NX30_SORBR|nr:hypothetical protein B0T20DRAFT_92550 [Sordaria brevicollis]
MSTAHGLLFPPFLQRATAAFQFLVLGTHTPAHARRPKEKKPTRQLETGHSEAALPAEGNPQWNAHWRKSAARRDASDRVQSRKSGCASGIERSMKSTVHGTLLTPVVATWPNVHSTQNACFCQIPGWYSGPKQYRPVYSWSALPATQKVLANKGYPQLPRPEL